MTALPKHHSTGVTGAYGRTAQEAQETAEANERHIQAMRRRWDGRLLANEPIPLLHLRVIRSKK